MGAVKEIVIGLDEMKKDELYNQCLFLMGQVQGLEQSNKVMYESENKLKSDIEILKREIGMMNRVHASSVESKHVLKKEVIFYKAKTNMLYEQINNRDCYSSIR